MFLFDGAEPSFYKCIIGSTPLAIHTDSYLIIIKGIYPMAAGILAALVGVDKLRDAMHGNGLSIYLGLCFFFQAYRDLPPHDIATVIIDNARQIHNFLILRTKTDV